MAVRLGAQLSMNEEIIVDNFAGGGGASTGIELACGRPVTIAINHDPDAILMHISNRKERRYHPTQKPVDMMEYFVRTYTDEGDTVLDSCMGSGSTGLACIRSGRRFVGFEKDPNIYATALGRMREEYQTIQRKGGCIYADDR